MEIAFWSLAFLSLYSYALFPLLVYAWSRLKGESWKQGDGLPAFTVIISVHNEERMIAEKISNALELNYPPDRFEIIVGSDGSTDRTNEIVSQFSDVHVHLHAFERLGKTACLNHVVPLARGDILLFTDANAMFPSDLLKKTARNFSDHRVGLVTGATRYFSIDGTKDVTGIYSRLDSWTKHQESMIGSCVGADGAVFAIRRDLFEPLAENDINDFVIPLKVIDQGFRAVLDPQIYCREAVSEDEKKAFRRQVRITNRTLWAIVRNIRFTNPFRFGPFAFFLISHKVLRFGVPLFFAASVVANLLLITEHPLYFASLLGYISFLVMGCLNYLEMTRDRVTGISKFFLLTITAQLFGLLRMLIGIEDKVWTPER